MTATIPGSPESTRPLRFRDLLALAARPLRQYLPSIHRDEIINAEACGFVDWVELRFCGRRIAQAFKNTNDGSLHAEVFVSQRRRLAMTRRTFSISLCHSAPGAFYADEIVLHQLHLYEKHERWYEKPAFRTAIGDLGITGYSAAQSQASLDAYVARKNAEKQAQQQTAN
jgi:hypothetical protein